MWVASLQRLAMAVVAPQAAVAADHPQQHSARVMVRALPRWVPVRMAEVQALQRLVRGQVRVPSTAPERVPGHRHWAGPDPQAHRHPHRLLPLICLHWLLARVVSRVMLRVRVWGKPAVVRWVDVSLPGFPSRSW